MNLDRFLTILYNSIQKHIEDENNRQFNIVEDILLKLEDEGYVKWICTNGHGGSKATDSFNEIKQDRCGEIYSGSDCPYCERRLLFR